jgi:hypothetical protein
MTQAARTDTAERDNVIALPERCRCWRDDPHPPHFWERTFGGRVKCPGVTGERPA